MVRRGFWPGLLLGLGVGLAIGIGSLARAASLDDARGLVQQFDPTLGASLAGVTVRTADRYPGPLSAPAWTDGRTIFYVADALRLHNPALSEADELALVLAKEGEQARQYRAATFNAGNCYAEELAGQRMLGQFWRWLWLDAWPNVAYNAMESAAVSDVEHPEANAAFGCAVLFGGLRW